MAWRDNMFKASFRNVPFEVESSADEGGRRNQKHEFPNKNTPFIEDMGKKAETFTIEAFVIGDDYTDKRNALRAACAAEGAGILKHPSYGEISVVCDSYNVAERYTSEGRMARFTMTFIESGVQEMPTATVDYSEQILKWSEEVEFLSIENFNNRFNMDGQPTAVATSVGGTATQFAEQASASVAYANSKSGIVSQLANRASSSIADAKSKVYDAKASVRSGVDAIDEITDVANQLDDLSRNAVSILDTPEVFSARVSACIGVLNSALSPLDAIRQTRSATNLGIAAQTTKVNPNTPKGAAQIELMEQIGALVERVGIAHQAKAISEIEFTNSQDAQKMLDDFTAQIEAQLLSTTPADEDVMQSLRDLRATVVRSIAETIRRLPEVRVIRLAENTPSVVLAYELYEDITRATEIVERNNINNPGFIPAGKDIEVLAL